MSPYQPTLSEPDELKNPRWICGCGETAPIAAPAYPVCKCGQRMRFVNAPGLSYVGSPQEER